MDPEGDGSVTPRASWWQLLNDVDIDFIDGHHSPAAGRPQDVVDWKQLTDVELVSPADSGLPRTSQESIFEDLECQCPEGEMCLCHSSDDDPYEFDDDIHPCVPQNVEEDLMLEGNLWIVVVFVVVVAYHPHCQSKPM